MTPAKASPAPLAAGGWVSMNSRTSSEIPSSVASAYSVFTDGLARPVSTWEMRLGDTPTSSARRRRLSPRARRASRSRSPIPAYSGSADAPRRSTPTRPPSLLLAQSSYLPGVAGGLRRLRVCVALVNGANRAEAPSSLQGRIRMRTFASPGAMTVDWEERVNPDRLRSYRFGRARAALDASELGSVLLFDFNNIRYVTSTHIGEWARDKMTRYALQTRGGTPHIWDFGSAAKHHRLNCPWLAQENIHAGMVGLRGAVAPDAGLFRRAAREICEILKAEGVLDMPLGVDIVEPPMIAALEAEGITVRDAPAGDARRPRGQVDRRDHAAQHRLLDGRRRLPDAVRAAQAGRPRE